jgi:hypothetical protein
MLNDEIPINRRIMLITKNKPSTNLNTAAVFDISLLTDLRTLLSATAAINVKNEMIKIAITKIRNNNTLSLILLAAINVASPGTSNKVFRERKTKKPINSLMVIAKPAFLAHKRRDKDNP